MLLLPVSPDSTPLGPRSPDGRASWARLFFDRLFFDRLFFDSHLLFGGRLLRCLGVLLACGTQACGPSFFAQEEVQHPGRALVPAEESVASPPDPRDLGEGCSPKGCVREPAPAATPSPASAQAANAAPRKVARPPLVVRHPLKGKGKEEIERLVKTDLASLGSMTFGSATRGGLINGVRLPEDDRWKMVDPINIWGTAETINYLVTAIDAVHEQFPDSQPLFIGDISAPRGGYLRPHISHQSGRDVDISYFYLSEPSWYERATPVTLDRPRTWALVRSLITRTDVHYIFIDRRVQGWLRQYAESIGEDYDWLESVFHGSNNEAPIILHEPGHATHLHVRFYNPIAEETARRCYPALLAQHKLLPSKYNVPYKAKSGDTLIGLAKRNGITVTALMQANGLTKKTLRADKTYLIPHQGPAGPAEPTPLPPRRLPPARPPTGAVATR
jgi:penicillin-insensitive murein endopeptidase